MRAIQNGIWLFDSIFFLFIGIHIIEIIAVKGTRLETMTTDSVILTS